MAAAALMRAGLGGGRGARTGEWCGTARACPCPFVCLSLFVFLSLCPRP